MIKKNLIKRTNNRKLNEKMESKRQSTNNSDQSVGPDFPEACQPSESLVLCEKKAQKYNGFKNLI